MRGIEVVGNVVAVVAVDVVNAETSRRFGGQRPVDRLAAEVARPGTRTAYLGEDAAVAVLGRDETVEIAHTRLWGSRSDLAGIPFVGSSRCSGKRRTSADPPPDDDSFAVAPLRGR